MVLVKKGFTYEKAHKIKKKRGVIMDDNIKTQIKVVLAKKNLTLTNLHQKLVDKYGQDKIGSLQNLSSKINRNTLRYEEALQIACVLGFTIKWIDKDNTNIYISPY